MADLEAIEVLTQAKERLFEHGWVNRPFSTRSREQESMFCLEEALEGRNGCPVFVNEWSSRPVRRAAQYVQSVLGAWDYPDYLAEIIAKRGRSQCLFIWNDLQDSATPVFDVIDAAILLAKEVSVIPALA